MPKKHSQLCEHQILTPLKGYGKHAHVQGFLIIFF